jgi:branched-chain amino acid transport system substrate-binding protein
MRRKVNSQDQRGNKARQRLGESAMRVGIRVILFSLMAIIVLWQIPGGADAERGVLRVGMIASLSGSQAQIGRDLRDGALLAIDGINEGWKDKEARIEVTVADDSGRPEQAKDAASRLIEHEQVDLLFGLADSDCALAVMPIVNQAEVPMLTLATHAGLTQPSQKWIFRGNISDDDQSKILVDLLWDRLPEKKIALLYEDSAYGRSAASAQAKRVRRYGLEPVAEVSYPRGESDFSSALEKIKASGAKGILIYGVASDASSILTAVRKLGMDVKIMASSGWDTRELLALPPRATDGVIVAGYLAFAQEDREEVLGLSWSRFARDFQKRFRREPDVIAALSYSNMMCVAEAWERMEFQSQRLTEGLGKTKAFKTLLESLVNFSDEGRNGVKSIHMAEFQDGKPRVWKRNQLVNPLRFEVPASLVNIGEYRGKIYETEPGVTMWMVLHFAFGRPPFIKEFTMVDEYGLKSCFMGALFKGQVRVPIVKLIFKSEEDAIEALNLEGFEAGGSRDTHSGLYTDGTFWAGYKRVKNMVVMAEGGIPREDLLMILETLAFKVKAALGDKKRLGKKTLTTK